MSDDYAAYRPKTSWTCRPVHGLDANPNALSFGLFVQPKKDPLRAIVSIDLYDAWGDAGHWLHLSISRERRLPTWGDLVHARDALGYSDLIFVQLIPPRSHWLNVHPHTLHLLHRLDAHAVPPLLWQGLGADGTNYEHAP